MTPIIIDVLYTLVKENLPKLANAVAEKGIDYVEQKTGIKLEPELDQTKVTELQKFEQDFEKFMIEKSDENTADARSMQEQALQQDDLFAKRFVYFFALFWSVFVAIYIMAITFGTIPEHNVRFSDTILGFMLGTLVSTIINFFYGSSNSSHNKQAQLEKIMGHTVTKATER